MSADSDKNIRLHIVGAGRLGKTLGRLFAGLDNVSAGCVVCSSDSSSAEAREFILADEGEIACENIDYELVLVATQDDKIAEMADVVCGLSLHGNAEKIAFHCSGSLSSKELLSLRQRGFSCASVHPVHSFAKPDESINNFAGTYCGYEGDEKALAVLLPLFAKIGGKTFAVQADKKLLYHAAAVFACNFLTVVQGAAFDLYEKAGVDNETAKGILEPIVTATVKNVFSMGAENALTGPAARKDHATIKKHLEALKDIGQGTEDVDSDKNSLYEHMYRYLTEYALAMRG